MKQKRLRASQFPKLVYPCEGCGVDIVEGKYCTSCAAKLRQEISRHEELERTELEKQREAERVYYTINRERDKK